MYNRIVAQSSVLSTAKPSVRLHNQKRKAQHQDWASPPNPSGPSRHYSTNQPAHHGQRPGYFNRQWTWGPKCSPQSPDRSYEETYQNLCKPKWH